MISKFPVFPLQNGKFQICGRIPDAAAAAAAGWCCNNLHFA